MALKALTLKALTLGSGRKTAVAVSAVADVAIGIDPMPLSALQAHTAIKAPKAPKAPKAIKALKAL